MTHFPSQALWIRYALYIYSHPDEIEKKRAFHRAGRASPVPSTGATGHRHTQTFCERMKWILNQQNFL